MDDTANLLSKHGSFYIDTVTFRVEDCLFRLPREPFATESTVFRDMFLLPTGDGREEEGKNDSNPIHLAEIKKEEFEQFLRVLFDRTNSIREDQLPETATQWKSVLKLANMWDFVIIHKTAIRYLQSELTPVEKIALGELYNLDFDSWLLPAMQDLMRRREPISSEEGLQLGLDTALKLASVREQISHTTTYSPHTRGYVASTIVGCRADVRNFDFTKALREVFKTT